MAQEKQKQRERSGEAEGQQEQEEITPWIEKVAMINLVYAEVCVFSMILTSLISGAFLAALVFLLYGHLSVMFWLWLTHKDV